MGQVMCRGSGPALQGWLNEEGRPCSDQSCDGWVEREATYKEEWQYVGQGKGDFDQVRGYNFVGDGRGSYKDSKSTRYHGWRLGNLGAGLLAGIASLAGGLLLWRVLASSGSVGPEPEELPDRRPQLAVALRSNGSAGADLPLFNCSSYYFEQPWTEAKAAWCCVHEGAGCSSTSKSRATQTTWMLLPVPVVNAASQGMTSVERGPPATSARLRPMSVPSSPEAGIAMMPLQATSTSAEPPETLSRRLAEVHER
mmetsp:Transcript_69381/g.206666  ORF Transcript_69381/g.206666 Transcript_69381/m.206666 type:complete len:254 (-) Transcript_69381:85-846(-)